MESNLSLYGQKVCEGRRKGHSQEACEKRKFHGQELVRCWGHSVQMEMMEMEMMEMEMQMQMQLGTAHLHVLFESLSQWGLISTHSTGSFKGGWILYLETGVQKTCLHV